MFKGLFQFLKSRVFLINLIIYSILIGGTCFGVMSWLASYTQHDKTISVPDFTGIKLADLDKFIEDKQVRYQIIDSLYDPQSPRGIVIRQEPEPKSLVKDNRTIYLYVTSLKPPGVIMPKLVDRSLRQATAMLISYGLKLSTVTHVPDECSNCVLEQLVKGEPVEPGKVIPKGTKIELVVGLGDKKEEVELPCLSGLSKKEAELRIDALSLVLGKVVYEKAKDSLISKVYDQNPSCKRGKVSIGTVIDIFLTTNKNKIANSTKAKKNDEDFD